MFPIDSHCPDPALLAIRADFPRFGAPLLFVSGLWTDASVWHAPMSLLAQRGWDCFALQLPSAAAHARLDWADWQHALGAAIGCLDAPPVLVAHDAGVLLALEVDVGVRACVGLAPFLPDAYRAAAPRAFSPWAAGLAAWRHKPLHRPERLAHEPPPQGWCATSAAVARAAAAWTVPAGLRSLPRLLVAGDADVLCPAACLANLAAACAADAESLVGAGHALPWGRGWDRHMAQMHRWLVQKFGAELLRESDTQEDAP